MLFSSMEALLLLSASGHVPQCRLPSRLKYLQPWLQVQGSLALMVRPTKWCSQSPHYEPSREFAVLVIFSYCCDKTL